MKEESLVESIDSRNILLKDGRTLIYAEYGDPEGFPIVGLHGMPGSRLMMKFADEAGKRSGVRIIAPERPGYGISQPTSIYALLAYQRDILELADHLKINQFAIMGISGGCPFALACAWGAPERVSAAAIVSGIGPLSVPQSTEDMMPTNKLMFNLGRRAPRLVGSLLAFLSKRSQPSMNRHIEQGTSPTPALSPEVFAVIAADQQEAVLNGGRGIAYDMKILWQPWGFQLEEIQTKVYLFHGEADDLAPVRLAHYMADRLPNCDAAFYPEEGHTDPLTRHIDEIFEKLLRAHPVLDQQRSVEI